MADTPKLNPSDRSVEAYEKINQSIDQSNSAKTAADNANTTADEAKQIAESSNTKSVRTQEQLDQVVIEGDSSVEAALIPLISELMNWLSKAETLMQR